MGVETTGNSVENPPARRISLLEREDLAPAGLFARLAALALDISISLSLMMAVLVTLSQTRNVDGLLVLVVPVLYFVVGHIRGGTPGKALVGLRVVDPDQRRPGLRRGLLRAAASLVTLLTGGLGYLTGYVDSRSRTLHDIFSGTEVVVRRRGGVVGPAVFACILAIGIYIFTFSFGPYIMRSPGGAKTAIANSEMRHMAVGLETYYIDHGMYPLPDQEGWVAITVIGPASGFTPRALTTPVSHQSTLPDDPYRKARFDANKPETFAYRYAANPQSCWIMASDGPDERPDIDLFEFVDPDGCGCDINLLLTHLGGKYAVYDPTNGTGSAGDIIRTGP